MQAPRGVCLRLGTGFLALTALAGAGRAAAPAPSPASPPPTPPDAGQIAAFLQSGAFKTWVADKEVRCAVGHDTWARVYYSPAVVAWLQSGRPPEGIPDGAMIVKEMYEDPKGQTVDGWAYMAKYKAGSFDGWFWGGAGPSRAGSGQYGLIACISCHASADNRELTFSSYGHIDGTIHEDPAWCEQQASAVAAARSRSVRLPHGHLPPPVPDAAPSPLPSPDPAFTRTFPVAWPSPIPTPPAFPPANAQPWLVAGPRGAEPFVTSNNCQSCHDGGRWLVLPPGRSQNMVAATSTETVNLSPYAEWAASLMGLAGRDPIFHAQLESEKAMRPQMTGFLDDTCYRCHGVMGQRQLALDHGQGFQHFMVYARPGDPAFKYGALARDGISCSVCHHVAADGLGTPTTYTGLFQVGPSNEVYGPFTDDVRTQPMRQALGITPRGAPQIRSSALCGSCHTVLLPKVPSELPGRPAAGGPFPLEHEQTTYLEWRHSVYQDERPPVDAREARGCRDCHMPRTFEGTPGADLAFRIANIEDYRFPDPQPTNILPRPELDLAVRKEYARHTLVGLNAFGLELFRQFSDLLGVPAADTTADTGDPSQPPLLSNLTLAARESVRLARAETARVEIVSIERDGARLRARVRVVNLAGHKLPSGVGFRRAFLELRVKDGAGGTVWVSGATDATGVVLGAGGRVLESEFSSSPRRMQPHYQAIDSEDQVQIYEERTADDQGRLTTSFLGLFTPVKDNRLLPRGWPRGSDGVPEYLRPHLPRPEGNGSSGTFYQDPAYEDGSGSDEIVYNVPADRAGRGVVEATLYYQAIPPYYLRDRFATARGIETQRLYYMASRLSLKGTAIEGWKLRVAADTRPIP
jgi:hypothetical protein